MANEQKSDRVLIEQIVGIGKDIVALLRDGALLALLLVLLLMPQRFNEVLGKAGVKEVNIAGVKWMATNDTLRDAEKTISDLKKLIKEMTPELEKVVAQTSDEVLKKSLVTLITESRPVQVASAEVEAAVKKTISINAPLVEKAQADVNTTSDWGVVFGSDVSFDAARNEIKKAADKGIASADIYFRNGYYASIAVAESRATAQEYLSIVKSFRPDAYIASITTWCRNPEQRNGFVECQNRRQAT
jgi:hypothetical protein